MISHAYIKLTFLFERHLFSVHTGLFVKRCAITMMIKHQSTTLFSYFI
jgi:hypothetical protein